MKKEYYLGGIAYALVVAKVMNQDLRRCGMGMKGLRRAKAK